MTCKQARRGAVSNGGRHVKENHVLRYEVVRLYTEVLSEYILMTVVYIGLLK